MLCRGLQTKCFAGLLVRLELELVLELILALAKRALSGRSTRLSGATHESVKVDERVAEKVRKVLGARRKEKGRG